MKNEVKGSKDDIQSKYDGDGVLLGDHGHRVTWCEFKKFFLGGGRKCSVLNLMAPLTVVRWWWW